MTPARLALLPSPGGAGLSHMALGSLRLPPPLWGRSARALRAQAGRGVLAPLTRTDTPLPIPPPQGGREQPAARSESNAIALPSRGRVGPCRAFKPFPSAGS